MVDDERSPQDEDHEAGIYEALAIEELAQRQETSAGVWASAFIGAIARTPEMARDFETMLSWFSVAIMAGYDRGKVADSSPSRVGSVAVEDVERLKNELQALVDWFNEAPFLRAERLLYDLSRSSTDRPEQPEPDVLGGQPPAEPEEKKDERRP